MIYGLDEAEGHLTVLAGPQLDQALFTFDLSNFHRRPRLPACPGDELRSGVIHEYLDRGVTFYWPLCSEIRTSLTSSYPYVTWNSFAWHEFNTVKPLGVVYETMAAKVSDTIGAYQAQTPRTVAVSSGYRTPRGNGSVPGATVNASRHMSGEAVDLIVPGYLDGTNYGGGPNDTTSAAFLTWNALRIKAVENGGIKIESWVYMYEVLHTKKHNFRVDGQNHLHSNWEGGHK